MQPPLPTSIDFAGWLGCLAFLIVFLNGLLKLADRIRGKPPHPPNAALSIEFQALNNRVARLETQFETIRAEIKNDRDTLMRSSEERAAKIHERINAIGERLTSAVAELRGEIKRIS